MSLISKTTGGVAVPIEGSPEIPTGKFLESMIEEAATTDGNVYEFCTPSQSKRDRAAIAQRILREWHEDIETSTDCVKRIAASAAKALMSNAVDNAQKCLERSVKAAARQRKWSIAMASAAVRGREAPELYEQVAERLKKIHEERGANTDVPVGPIRLKIAIATCAKFHIT